METQLQHRDHFMTSHDEAAHDSALPNATLREITNHRNKHLLDQLERTDSGSLQQRDSNSAASGPDAHDSPDRVVVPHLDPALFQQVNIAELIRAAAAAETAEQVAGKHRQPSVQVQTSVSGMPQHRKPSSHSSAPLMQADRSASLEHAQTTTTLDPAGHSSVHELPTVEGDDTAAAAAAAAQLVGMSGRSTTDSDPKCEHAKGQAPCSGQPNSVSAAPLHRNTQTNTGKLPAAALVNPQGFTPYEAFRGYQPPLSADPDNISAWDTPRLEQLPVKLPEPRSKPHMIAVNSNSADPACKAGSAYDVPRAAQGKGGEGVIVEDSADGTWPAHVMVVCNGNVGKFLLMKQSMVCTCKLCQTKAAKMGVAYVDMTPTEFERHSGMAASKKWKYTVRIQQDGRPIGNWLDNHGYAPRATQRERPAPSDSKMATRDRNRLRDRSKSSDVSCEPSSSALPTWQPQIGPSRLAAPGLVNAPAAAAAPAAPPSMPAAPEHPNPRSSADLLVQAAAAVHRAEALQRAEASESDVSPRSRQSGPRPANEQGARRRQKDGREERQRAKRGRAAAEGDAEATGDELQQPQTDTQEAQLAQGLPEQAARQPASETRRVKRKTIVQPQLRESPSHQAVIPDKLGDPPAPVELPLRWEAGPSFEEAMASARGPEKAAADLLPLDATFDPETHEGAALSSHAGRHQRALPDKRARRKPVWLDGTIDPKMAAQMAIQHTTGIEPDAQSDAERNDSGGATCSNPELRWPHQRHLRAHPATRKRDREDAVDADT